MNNPNNPTRSATNTSNAFIDGVIGGLILALIPFLVFICLTTTEAEVIAKVDAVLATVGR